MVLDGVEVAVSTVRGLAMPAAGPAPAPADEPRVRLGRVVTGDRRLYDWALSSQGTRGEVIVEVWGGRADRPVASWALVGARPVRWHGPDLDAMTADVAREELEVRYDRLEWRYPQPER